MEKTEFQLKIVKEREQGINDAIARIKKLVLAASNRLDSHILLDYRDEKAYVKFDQVKKELANLGLTTRYWSMSDKAKHIELWW